MGLLSEEEERDLEATYRATRKPPPKPKEPDPWSQAGLNRAQWERYYELTIDCFERFCSEVIKIRYKDTRFLPPDKRDALAGKAIGPFYLKKVQRALANRMISALRDGAPVRVIILKARQQGFTTLIGAFILWYQQIKAGSGALILGYDNDATNMIVAETYDVMMDHADTVVLPKSVHKPKGDFYVFPNASRYAIRTAGTKATSDSVGSGLMNHIIHATELAKWRDATGTMDSLLPSFAKGEGSIFIIESTPLGKAGKGAEFYARWTAANLPTSDTIAWFSAWYEDETYQLASPIDWLEGVKRVVLAVKEGRKPDDVDMQFTSLTADEVTWMVDGIRPCASRGKVKLTPQQLWWRRNIILEDYSGDVARFNRDYPKDDVSCFVASGNPVFTGQVAERLNDMLQMAKAGERYEVLLDMGEYKMVEKKFTGWLEVWKGPTVGHRYVIGADLANSGPCLYAFVVVDRNTGEHVAQYVGRPEQTEFADYIAAAAAIYKPAIVGIERNLGQGVIDYMLRHYPWVDLYTQVQKYSFKTLQDSEPAASIGWWTSSMTRPILVTTFSQLISMGYVKTSSFELLQQATAWIRDDSGQPTTPTKADRDDVLMSSLIAYRVHHETMVEKNDVIPEAKVQDNSREYRPTVASVLEEDARRKAEERRQEGGGGFVWKGAWTDDIEDAYGGDLWS